MTYAPSSQPVFYRDRKVTRVGFTDIQNYKSIEGRFGFAGVDDHYFLAAELSPPDPIRLQYEPVVVPVEGQEQGLHFVSWSIDTSETASPAGGSFSDPRISTFWRRSIATSCAPSISECSPGSSSRCCAH